MYCITTMMDLKTLRREKFSLVAVVTKKFILAEIKSKLD